jgi:large subunit ribosomal protein L5e
VQAKNKYSAPKYRLVVRITNTDVICQIVFARIIGDIVLASAYSHELPQYGVKVGLTNYAAAYCTGLLCARRALTKLGLASQYKGVEKADGSLFLVDPIEDGPRPFKVFLDVGLRRTSTGSRVFAAMKGAADGGVFIPHSERRFPGFDEESGKLDAEVLNKYIYGTHVADYMRQLAEDDEEKYKKQFSKFIAAGVTADSLEAIYTKAHELIRAKPEQILTKKDPAAIEKYKKFKKPRLSYEQRKERIQKKIAEFQETLNA